MSSSLKFLVKGYHRSFGRNFSGRICSYYRGGGVKKKYRFFDLNSNFSLFDNKIFFFKFGTVICFTYDPFRNTQLALIKWFFIEPFLFHFNSYSYILAVSSLYLNKPVFFSVLNLNFLDLNFVVGSCLRLCDVLPGIFISNVGGLWARAAGSHCLVINKIVDKVLIELPSKKKKWVSSLFFVTIGVCLQRTFSNKYFKKAGRSRWLGFRPCVRGVAMNPVDHPHGGGEGKTSGGRPSVSPWGKLTKKCKKKGI